LVSTLIIHSFSYCDYLSFLIHTSHRNHQHIPSFPTRRSSDLSEGEEGIAVKTYEVTNEDGKPAEKNLIDTKVKKESKNKFFSAGDRKSTRLNSSHVSISYAVFCLKKKRKQRTI